VKGERLQPVPGRADDQSWPRPETARPVVMPAATAPLTKPGEPAKRPARQLPAKEPQAKETLRRPPQG
ncbi:MAG: cell envelope biogenesis protein TolA, partial [Hyphomicrobium sp.]